MSEASGHPGFDLHFAATDGSLGGYVTLTGAPGADVVWYWACLVGRNRPLVAVVDHEVPRPTGSQLRTSGLWAEIIDQIPGRHLTVGLEAFGLSFDDVADVFGSGRGDRVPLGFDLEWETEPDGASGIEQPCRVRGDVLVGHETLDLDGWGFRRQADGSPSWPEGTRIRGRFDDGTTLTGDDLRPAAGFLPTVRVGDRELAIEPVSWAPVLVPDGDGSLRLLRALARVVGPDVGGWAWIETVQTS